MKTSKLSRSRPKKHLGQHFLVNPGIQQKIIESCHLSSEDVVLEVGPGEGVLTQFIVPQVKKLVAVEKDKQLIDHLSKRFRDNVEFIHEDILEFPFDKLKYPVKLIGNLPYYISTPIIEKIIEYRHVFKDVFIMVQKEYAQRMVAKPNSKDYGSLSCFVQLFSEPKILFKISPGSFRPPPKVESCFVYLKMSPCARFPLEDPDFLEKIIRTAFQQRRKTLENSLETVVLKKDWEGFDVPFRSFGKLRAENLSLEDFIGLSQQVKKV